MPVRRKKLGTVIGVISLLVAVLVIFSLEHEVSGPDGWPSTVKLYRNRVTGVTWAVDTETRQTLFMYWPEYDMHVHPVKIERIDSNHWQVVFEDPKTILVHEVPDSATPQNPAPAQATSPK